MIHVIGIGSPFGDDDAGLLAARRLAADQPLGCVVMIADRPGSRLIDLFEGADDALLIDAVCGGLSPGTLHDLDLRHLPAMRVGRVSTHDLDLPQLIELALRLGRAPRRGRLLGIEIAPESAREPHGLSPAVSAGIDCAVERAREWARRWQPHGAPAAPSEH